MSGRWLRLASLLLALVWPPASSSAEPPRRARVAREAAPKRAKRPKKERRHAEKVESREPREAAPESAATAKDSAQKAAQEAAQGANAEIVKEGDTSVKVMKFTGLDIEGRLKSPQLLYFVNRIHTEFDRPKLPHRSFMPELNRSTEQEPLR